MICQLILLLSDESGCIFNPLLQSHLTSSKYPGGSRSSHIVPHSADISLSPSLSLSPCPCQSIEAATTTATNPSISSNYRNYSSIQKNRFILQRTATKGALLYLPPTALVLHPQLYFWPIPTTGLSILVYLTDPALSHSLCRHPLSMNMLCIIHKFPSSLILPRRTTTHSFPRHGDCRREGMAICVDYWH